MDATSTRSDITVRAVTPGDYPLLFALRRDVDLQSLLLTIPDSVEDQAVLAWIERRTGEQGGMFRMLEDTLTGTAVGFIQVSGVHRRNRIGNGGICLADSARNRGFGRRGLEKLIAHSRDTLGLTKLLAEIRSDNTASQRLHAAAGYRLVGILEKHFIDHNGTPHDVCIMEKFIGTAESSTA